MALDIVVPNEDGLTRAALDRSPVGNGLSNARFQSTEGAGLTADDVPNLRLKWAFGFPGANSSPVNGQQVMVRRAGRLERRKTKPAYCSHKALQ